MVQAQIAERAKGLLGILESPPEFGTPPGAPPERRCGRRAAPRDGNRRSAQQPGRSATARQPIGLRALRKLR